MKKIDTQTYTKFVNSPVKYLVYAYMHEKKRICDKNNRSHKTAVTHINIYKPIAFNNLQRIDSTNANNSIFNICSNIENTS